MPNWLVPLQTIAPSVAQEPLWGVPGAWVGMGAVEEGMTTSEVGAATGAVTVTKVRIVETIGWLVTAGGEAEVGAAVGARTGAETGGGTTDDGAAEGAAEGWPPPGEAAPPQSSLNGPGPTRVEYFPGFAKV